MPLTIEKVTNRPLEMQAKIAEKFAINAILGRDNMDALNHHYRTFGKKQYFYSCSYLSISSTLLLLAMSKTKSHLRVLDIGTGDGEFIQFINDRLPHIKAVGLSARDMREKNSLVGDSQYIVGNAECLLSLPSIQNKPKFDVILSSNTFMHFQDPLGVLISAYELLEENGVIMIDRFDLPGLQKLSGKLIAYLRNQGYEIDGSDGYEDDVRFIFIKKTKPHLVIPVSYDGSVYCADQPLIQFDENEEKYRDNEKYLKAFFAATIPLNDVSLTAALDDFNRIDQLISLLNEKINNLIALVPRVIAVGYAQDSPIIENIMALQKFVLLNSDDQKKLIQAMFYNGLSLPDLVYTETSVSLGDNFMQQLRKEMNPPATDKIDPQQRNLTLFPPVLSEKIGARAPLNDNNRPTDSVGLSC